VQDVLGFLDADIDERVALPLAKALAEDHDVLAVHQHALGLSIAHHVRYEVEARLFAPHATVPLVQRVDALQELLAVGRARHRRRGRSGRGGSARTARFARPLGLLGLPGGLVRRLHSIATPLESPALDRFPREQRRGHAFAGQRLVVAAWIETLRVALFDGDAALADLDLVLDGAFIGNDADLVREHHARRILGLDPKRQQDLAVTVVSAQMFLHQILAPPVPVRIAELEPGQLLLARDVERAVVELLAVAIAGADDAQVLSVHSDPLVARIADDVAEHSSQRTVRKATTFATVAQPGLLGFT